MFSTVKFYEKEKELHEIPFPLRLGGLKGVNATGENSNTSDFKAVCPRGVMVKTMDCGIVVSEFVLQSRYYVHFRANTLRKGMNPLILPAMG